MTNPITTIANSPTISKSVKIFIFILMLALLIAVIYFVLLFKKISWSKIKLLISQDSVKYENPVDAEEIILQGVREIVFDYNLLKQAKMYSKKTSIPLERVLVDNAIAIAKNFNYIKAKTIIIVKPTDVNAAA